MILLFVVEVLFILKGASSTNSDGAVIILSSSNTIDNYFIVKNVGDVLELTCIQNNLDNNKLVDWLLPFNTHNRAVFSKGLNGSLTVSVKHLEEDDSGEYTCGLRQSELPDEPCSPKSHCPKNKYTSYTSLRIFVKKKSCLGFQCSPNICILDRYVCDGKRDCSNNEDESLLTCGPDPCENKIKCPSGRCIPQEWCCINVENCTRKWDVNCCPHLKRDKTDGMNYLGSPDHYQDHIRQSYEDTGHVEVDLPSDISLLQTLIHTVIGCALVFVVIGPVLVIAGCKLYTRRRNCSQGTTLSSAPRISSYHSDRHICFPSVAYRLPSSNEVSSGDELDAFTSIPWDVERPMQDCGEFRISQPQGPPPYSEVMISHHDDDPPPPYMSTGQVDDDSPVKEAAVFPIHGSG